MTADSEYPTLAQAAALLRTRRLSPVELVRGLLARTEALEPQVHAFITPTPEIALRQARQAEAEIVAGHWRGPLHGIPYGLKDIYDTAGVRTTAHSKTLIDNVPAVDAAAVARLHAGGAVLMGKLGTHEFAIGGPSHDLPWPIPRNPWHTAHYVGGSSSGSAAAVAAGFVLGALGSDTGASIRNPAALAGLAGLKPTYGLVSRRGVIPNACSFDTCGPMAWTVEDCAILLQAIAGYDAADPGSLAAPIADYPAALTPGLRGVRIGIIRHFWEEELPVNAELARAMDDAVRVFTELGAVCRDVRVRPMRDYHDVRMIIAECELLANHQAALARRAGDFGAEFLRKVLPGCLFQGADYVQAQRERRVMLEEMQPLYRDCDLLLTAAAGPAPRLDQFKGLDFWSKPSIFNLFNVTGGPALSVCNGFAANGLPLGMQIAAAPYRDDAVLRAGHAYECATAWRTRRPLLQPGAAAPAVASATEPAPAADPRLENWIELSAQRAGLPLDARSRAMLLSAAPYAMAMAERINRRHARAVEPASQFGFPR